MNGSKMMPVGSAKFVAKVARRLMLSATPSKLASRAQNTSSTGLLPLFGKAGGLPLVGLELLPMSSVKQTVPPRPGPTSPSVRGARGAHNRGGSDPGRLDAKSSAKGRKVAWLILDPSSSPGQPVNSGASGES